MSKRRNFKKNIRYACGDLAAECIMAKYFVDDMDSQAMDNAVVEIARIQETLLSRANVKFDKSAEAFENKAQYRKAHRDFMHKAFKSLNQLFIAEVNKVVKEMNKALPEKQKELNKKSV